MATVAITPAELAARDALRAPAEKFLGGNPGQDARKINDKAERFTAQLRKDAERQIKAIRADQPVTILNLNPKPLKINGGVYFPDEIPRCKPGQPYEIYRIADTRWGHKDRGCDAQGMMQMEPVPAIPLQLASEYIREFGESLGGVVCYLGDEDPASFKRGKKIQVPRVAFSDSGDFYVDLVEVDFHDELDRARKERNRKVLHRLQDANSWYENDDQRALVNDTHRDDARLAVEEGLIPELPRWVMQANVLPGKQPDPCPVCKAVPKAGAIMCVNCNYIIDIVETFRLRPSECSYGCAEMDRLTPEQWKAVDAIHAERTKLRNARKGTA